METGIVITGQTALGFFNRDAEACDRLDLARSKRAQRFPIGWPHKATRSQPTISMEIRNGSVIW